MDELEITAYHEAAHAVCRHLLGGRTKHLTIGIQEQNGRIKYGSITPDRTRWMEFEDEVMVSFAGMCVEDILGVLDESYVLPLDQYVSAPRRTDEWTIYYFAVVVAEDANRDIVEVLSELKEKATQLLRGNWVMVEAVKIAALEKMKLTGKQVERIIEDARMNSVPVSDGE